MIRVLIVDDEHVEREALKMMMEKDLNRLKVVGQAENGKKAVELAKTLQPDLILMDVKMPGMDGLEATEKILGFHPCAKFIMISAYDTFEYARRALRMGVRDYLLKPSKTKEILAIIEKVAGEIEAERKEEAERAAEKEKLRKLAPVLEADLVTQLLYEHVHEIDIHELMPFFGIEKIQRAFVLLLFIHSGPSRDASGIDEVYREVRHVFHRCFDGWVGAMAGNKIPLIVLSDETSSYRAQASKITRKLLNLSERYEDLDFFVGIGGEYEKPEQMRHSFYEALIASSDPFLPSGHCFYMDLDASGRDDAFSMEWEKDILEEVRQGKFSSIQQKLSEFIDRHQTCGKTVSEAQQRVLEILFTMAGMMRELGVQTEKPIFSFQIHHYRDLKAETRCLVEKMADAHAEMKKRFSPDVSRRVKQYILEHAHERISLESIAESVQLSPFYVSKLFKEQFGKNYIDFLTECRIEKAKQLMLDERKTLKEIAIEVGYRDPNYFSRVFKKVCGVSAKAYRHKIMNR